MVREVFSYSDSSPSVVTQDGKIEAEVNVTAYVDSVFGAYTTNLPILGTYWGFAGVMQFNVLSDSAKVGLVGRPLNHQSSTVGGLGDTILVPALLGWSFGQFHVAAALATYLPTGSYDHDRIISSGLNRWAIEPNVGLTWMDAASGREASLYAGYTVNFENTSTHYRSGNEFHTDFVAAQHLQNGYVLGLAGYAFQQTTADSGRGAYLGSFEGRVFGLGPLVGRTFRVSEIPLTLTAKNQFEFAAANRTSWQRTVAQLLDSAVEERLKGTSEMNAGLRRVQ
jgi:hypothetical protein